MTIRTSVLSPDLNNKLAQVIISILVFRPGLSDIGLSGNWPESQQSMA